MKTILMIMVLLLTGCAQFAEISTEQQDRELENNRAEVLHAEREICQQSRAAVVYEVYADRLSDWHLFCGYTDAN